MRVDDEVPFVLVGGQAVGLWHHALVQLLALADADLHLAEVGGMAVARSVTLNDGIFEM